MYDKDETTWMSNDESAVISEGTTADTNDDAHNQNEEQQSARTEVRNLNHRHHHPLPIDTRTTTRHEPPTTKKQQHTHTNGHEKRTNTQAPQQVGYQATHRLATQVHERG